MVTIQDVLRKGQYVGECVWQGMDVDIYTVCIKQVHVIGIKKYIMVAVEKSEELSDFNIHYLISFDGKY
jgi:hypothetical protein